MAEVDPTTSVSVTLEVQQWNQILDIMSSGPYRVVAPLIAKIVEQATSALNNFAPGTNIPSSLAGVLGNGDGSRN